MQTYYSLVNPMKWTPSQENTNDNIIQRYSSDHTFQSVMYAHYINICKLTETIGFLNVLSDDYKIYCLSYTHRDQYLKAVDIDDIKCKSGTVYHFGLKYHHDMEYPSDAIHYPPQWNLIHGDLLTMKKFTQAYKTQEGDKLNGDVYDPATKDLWDTNPPRGVLYVHLWSRTGMNIQLIDES
jgi:hypothetical protein